MHACACVCSLKQGWAESLYVSFSPRAVVLPWVGVCTYALRHRERWTEREKNEEGRCKRREEVVLIHSCYPFPPFSFFIGELQVCILSECIDRRTALHEHHPRPQRTPQGFQQPWTDVLNKPNVRSKHLLLQPHIRLACDGEGTRESVRERGWRSAHRKDEGRDADSEK